MTKYLFYVHITYVHIIIPYLKQSILSVHYHYYYTLKIKIYLKNKKHISKHKILATQGQVNY